MSWFLVQLKNQKADFGLLGCRHLGPLKKQTYAFLVVVVVGSITKQVRSFGCRCLGPIKKGVVFLDVVVVGPIQQQKYLFLAVVVLVQLKKNKKRSFGLSWLLVHLKNTELCMFGCRGVGPIERNTIMSVWLSWLMVQEKKTRLGVFGCRCCGPMKKLIILCWLSCLLAQ